MITDEAEVKALAEKLEQGHKSWHENPIVEYWEALARVALEDREERRQEYIDRLNNRAIGQSYREED